MRIDGSPLPLEETPLFRDDLLEVSRIITGKLQLDIQPLDLSKVAASALETVTPAAEAKGVRLVSDSGAGIAPAILPHVFERFMQGDSSTTRAHAGLGLGLAIVRHLVELHGGTVTAESDGEGRGATFRVWLPLAVERK